MIRRLEGPEIAAYDMVPDQLARRVRIVRTPVLPPGADGMALGTVVFLRDDTNRSGSHALLAHELVHVRQYHQQGVVGFLTAYGRDYLRQLRHRRRHRAAYLAIDAEIEARAETEAWQRRRR